MIPPELIEAVARAICREQCAFFGEPPCHETGPWPNKGCNEPGCHALAAYKGVQWSKRRAKWKATIVVARKQRHLGFFDDILAARDAYAKGSLKYHGDFGRTDNPSTDAAVEALKALAAASGADNPKRKVKEAMR